MEKIPFTEENWTPMEMPNVIMKITVCPKCKGVGRMSPKHKNCVVCHGSGMKTEFTD